MATVATTKKLDNTFMVIAKIMRGETVDQVFSELDVNAIWEQGDILHGASHAFHMSGNEAVAEKLDELRVRVRKAAIAGVLA